MIGYTPDGHQSVAWLPTTDENHYLTDSAGTASETFRNVANSVLPYADGTQFDSVKNSMQNGIAPVEKKTTETDSKEDQRFLLRMSKKAGVGRYG